MGKDRGRKREMKQVCSLVLLVALGAAGLFGQKASPIWQQVFSNRTTAGTVIVKNNGQSFHQLYGVVSNNGGVCSRNTSGMFLEGSYDQTSWTKFSATAIPDYNGTGNNTVSLVAQGTYPFVRVNLAVVGANCLVNMYYSGTLDSLLSVPTANADASGFLTRAASGDATNSLVATAFDNVLLGRNVLYGMQISSDVATAALTTILVGYEATPGVCLGLGPGFSVASGSLVNVFLPTSTIPYGTAYAGSALCVKATPGLTLNTNTIYRKE